MRFRERRQEEVGIDLTPFIDVVFMLLLFFVVSTTLFKGATQLGVQLPQANAKELAKDRVRTEIGVDAQGNYYLDGASLGSDSSQLKAALSSRSDEKKSKPLILVGDKLAPHQAVVSALEVAGELGITQVQIVAQQRSVSHEQKNKS